MWIEVKGDGSIPEEVINLGQGEWEYKYRGFDRVILAIDCARDFQQMFEHTGSSYDFVAVRPREHIKVKAFASTRTPAEIIRDGLAAGRRIASVVPTPIQVRKSDSMLAYHRFRRSPRGKEALAMIGKREAPTPMLGEAQMVEIFNRALDEFEAEIERKKCSPLS